KDVRPEQARSYLVRHGWAEKPDPRPVVWLFEEPPPDRGRPAQLIVARNDKASDYPQRVVDLITTLAILEDRRAVAGLKEMLAWPSEGTPQANGAGRSPRKAASKKPAQKTGRGEKRSRHPRG